MRSPGKNREKAPLPSDTTQPHSWGCQQLHAGLGDLGIDLHRLGRGGGFVSLQKYPLTLFLREFSPSPRSILPVEEKNPKTARVCNNLGWPSKPINSLLER